MPEWLDLELSHHLAPVEAPADLWNRVCAARKPRPVTHFSLPIAAVVTLILGGTLYFIARGAPSPRPDRSAYSANVHTECLTCHTTL